MFLSDNEMEKVSRRKKENVWDFALLNPLTEEGFLKTLHCRFQQDYIYVQEINKTSISHCIGIILIRYFSFVDLHW